MMSPIERDARIKELEAERDRYREGLERIAAAGDHRSLTIRSTAYMANLARDALSEDVEAGKR